MKRVLLVILLLALGIASSPAVRADASPLTLTINNHQGLVTVTRDDGGTLFHQKIASANVSFTGAQMGKQVRLSLQDTAGKTLWTQTDVREFETIRLEGDWVKNSRAGMDAVSAAVSAKFPKFNDAKVGHITITIGPDSQVVSILASVLSGSKPHTFMARRLPKSYSVLFDKTPFQVPLPPPYGETSPATGR